MWQMRCPANHAANDAAAEVAFIREWAAADAMGQQHPPKPAGRRPLPCLPRHGAPAAGDDGTGRQAAQHGRCPCCAAVWITDDERGWTCLDTGKLIYTHAT